MRATSPYKITIDRKEVDCRMKRKNLRMVAALSALCLLGGCSQADPPASSTASSASAASSATVQAESPTSADALALVKDPATTQAFTTEAVAEADVETILTAGINTPSAMNGQPWHFSVITDDALLQQIAADMQSGMSPDGTPPEGMGLPEDLELPEDLDPSALPEGTALPEDLELPEGMEEGGFTAPPEDMSGGNDPAGTAGTAAKAGIADAPLVIVVSCTDGSELDAGLACQNMSVAAQLLGYGTKIISSPTLAVNGEKQAEYRELLGIPEDQTAIAFLLVGRADTSASRDTDASAGASTRNPLDEMVTYTESLSQ